MLKKIKKYQRLLLVILIAICMVIIIAGGVYYIEALRENLQENAIQNVMDLTMQHRQAFDNFIEGDMDRLHGYAEYFTSDEYNDPKVIQRQLEMLHEADAVYSIICIDEGWFCSNLSEDIHQVGKERLEYYSSLSGSGVRDNFLGLLSGLPKFGYYEIFTFSNGHRGLIQKTYDRNKVSEDFSLTFYNGRGFSYILNEDGDILLRSFNVSSEGGYENIFDALTDSHGQPEYISNLHVSMDARETGSVIFSGDDGEFVYTYVPVETVDGWCMVSIVPVDAITEETNQMLLKSQMALALLVLILIICAVFILLIWRTQKEMKEKDQALDYQSQLSRVISEYLSSNTDDMYMLLDQETEKLEYVSPNVERVLGVEADEIFDMIQESDMAADPEATRAYYEELNAMVPGESLAPRNTERVNPKTGEHKYFVENAYCVVIQNRPKRLAYISDRTKEIKAQNNLTEALRIAQAANEAKSAFLSNVSHDIRTPMNAIIGFLSLMQNEANNPEMVLEYTKRIDAASQHLLSLINDVLDMNKIESGSATLSIAEMNLAELIDEINTIIRPQTKAKNQAFDIFVSRLKHEHLLGDKLRINQILINLLSNAVKYTPENGTIEMRVEELPQVVDNYSRIRFTVKDNGLGMSADYLKVIFDPFTREETKNIHQIQGTGLGMAITKSLVDLMGGMIRVKSKPDQGSIFTVELELYIQEQENDPMFWEEHGVTRMIVADDEEDVCRNIVRIMSKTDVHTDYSTDGRTAIQMMRSAREAGRPYDLILLDWKMPTLNGLETARLIRKNYSKKIPILLLTAYDWSEIEQEAAEIGVDHFMPKPFFMSTFKGAIRRVMGSQKKEEDRQAYVVRGKHILVVDDIEVNRIILVKILSSQGAVCDTAGDGREAVEKFVASQPGEYDLILMDIQMPVLDGHDATRMIRSSGHPSAKSVPIIAMTANAFVEDVRDAIDAGMDAHIAKPVQVDKLKATIQQVFDSRRG